MTVAAALRAARLQILAAEASLLLAAACGQSRSWLVAHDDEMLLPDVVEHYDNWVMRRAAGEPVAYILGWREFYGHRFGVAPGVLIPRPETELLVEQGLAAIQNMPRPCILDLGTGSGCIAISLALARPDAEVWAVDSSSVALQIAAANATALNAKVRFIESDWLSDVPAQLFDLIVSNPPYIAPDDPHLGQGDLRFEPGSALAAADGGCADLRQIVAAAQGRLHSGGWLLCEHGYDQGPAMREWVAEAGLLPRQWQDLAGITRVTGGQAT